LEQRKVEEQQATIARLETTAAKQVGTITELKSTVAQQQKGLQIVMARRTGSRHPKGERPAWSEQASAASGQQSLKLRQHFTISRHVSPLGGFLLALFTPFWNARVLVRFDHIACFIENPSHGAMWTAENFLQSTALLIAFGSAYHRRPNGSASEIRSTPRCSARWGEKVMPSNLGRTNGSAEKWNALFYGWLPFLSFCSSFF
jgi:hypothetical protein